MYNIYCIECFTPNHFYVGQSSQVFHRLYQHTRGQGSRFTKEHGVKFWSVVNDAVDYEDALIKEFREYQYQKSLGHVVGGFSKYENGVSDRPQLAIGETEPIQGIVFTKDLSLKPYVIPSKENRVRVHAIPSEVFDIIDNNYDLTMRAKARLLIPILNRSEEACMSLIRRALGRL